MTPFLRYATERQPEIISFIRELVHCESPSGSPAAINRFVDLLVHATAGFGRAETFPSDHAGKTLRIEFDLPGAPAAKQEQILALAHSDTVWPEGALKAMPWR